MTRDDILRMAREAHVELLASGKGMHVWHKDAYVGDIQAFCERFHAIAVAEERKACAKLCDELVLEHPGRADLTANQCAAAIRARGDK